jgi:hypothetical protein
MRDHSRSRTSSNPIANFDCGASSMCKGWLLGSVLSIVIALHGDGDRRQRLGLRVLSEKVTVLGVNRVERPAVCAASVWETLISIM